MVARFRPTKWNIDTREHPEGSVANIEKFLAERWKKWTSRSGKLFQGKGLVLAGDVCTFFFAPFSTEDIIGAESIIEGNNRTRSSLLIREILPRNERWKIGRLTISTLREFILITVHLLSRPAADRQSTFSNDRRIVCIRRCVCVSIHVERACYIFLPHFLSNHWSSMWLRISGFLFWKDFRLLLSDCSWQFEAWEYIAV